MRVPRILYLNYPMSYETRVFLTLKMTLTQINYIKLNRFKYWHFQCWISNMNVTNDSGLVRITDSKHATHILSTPPDAFLCACINWNNKKLTFVVTRRANILSLHLDNCLYFGKKLGPHYSPSFKTNLKYSSRLLPAYWYQIRPRRHQLSSSQYSASSLGYDLKSPTSSSSHRHHINLRIPQVIILRKYSNI